MIFHLFKTHRKDNTAIATRRVPVEYILRRVPSANDNQTQWDNNVALFSKHDVDKGFMHIGKEQQVM